MLEDFGQSINAQPIWVVACAIGIPVALVSLWRVRRSLLACDVTSWSDAGIWGVVAGGVAVGLTYALLECHVQEVPEVRPAVFWWVFRSVFFAVLIVQLVSATATDLRTHYILDSSTMPGMVLAVLMATLSGDLQMCHLWVDWNQVVPQLSGPYIPDWIKVSPHLHGLAWSMAGLVTGGGLIWLSRAISSWVLGQEALGFGDVTLMAMIGAFLGWQPVLIVFLIAPLCALLAGLLVRVLSKRTYVPYGPYLSLAALIVLFSWRWIWMFEVSLGTGVENKSRAGRFALRNLFGDPTGLAILGGIVFGGLTLLLGGLRLYWSIPVAVKSEEAPTDSTATEQIALEDSESL